MAAYTSGIEVIFGFSKKRYNSTNQSFEQHFKCFVRLKEPCSIVHPIFIIDRNAVTQIQSPTNFSEINYCRCTHFLRYYWISDVIYGKNDVVEVHCDCDVLATWHDHIKDMDAYMLYCSHKDLANCGIDDNRLQPEQPIVVDQTPIFDPDFSYSSGGQSISSKYWDINDWSYIIDTEITESFGSLAAKWVLNYENFCKLTAGVLYSRSGLTNSTWTWTDFCEYLKQTFGGQGRISDFIKNIRVVPIPYSSYTGEVSEHPYVIVGPYELNGVTKILPGGEAETDVDKAVVGKLYIKNTQIRALNSDITLPVDSSIVPVDKTGVGHGGKNTDPYFLRGSRFCKFGLRHPSGILWFDTNQLCNYLLEYKVNVRLLLDILSGDYTIEVTAGVTKDFLGSASGNLATMNLSLFSSGGSADIMSNLFTNIATKGVTALEGIINAKVNPTVTTTKTSYANTKAVAENGAWNSTSSGTKETETTAPAQLNLGIFGSFFPGRYSIETGTSGNSTNGLINCFQAAVKYSTNSQSGVTSPVVDNKYLFSIIGTGQVPAVIWYSQYDDWAALHGYPYSKMINIKSNKIPVGSYCQFSCATIDMSNAQGHCMLPEEASQLNTFLNSGFFYEGPGEGEEDEG